MPKTKSFEKSVQELDSIVEQMESGELSLEQSLELFEKGIKLTRECQKTLADAEHKLQQLMNDTNNKEE